MLNPIQIDERISDEVARLRIRRATIERELEWHNQQITKLQAARDCDHEPTMRSSERDWCPKCEFDWVR